MLISAGFDNNVYNKKGLMKKNGSLLYLSREILFSNYCFEANIIAI